MIMIFVFVEFEKGSEYSVQGRAHALVTMVWIRVGCLWWVFIWISILHSTYMLVEKDKMVVVDIVIKLN